MCPFHTPCSWGEREAPVKSRGLRPCEPGGIRKRRRRGVGYQSWHRAEPRCLAKGGREGSCGAGSMSGGAGQGTPPCRFPATSCFRPDSARILASGARPPRGRCRPQLLTRSVCFLSHFAKCLLIFSTKSWCLCAKGRLGQHSLQQEARPATARTNNPTANTNQSQQQVANPAPNPLRAALP